MNWKPERFRKPLLVLSLSVSLILHAGLFLWFFSYPTLDKVLKPKNWFHNAEEPELLVEESPALLKKMNLALEDSFNTVIAAAAQSKETKEAMAQSSPQATLRKPDLAFHAKVSYTPAPMIAEKRQDGFFEERFASSYTEAEETPAAFAQDVTEPAEESTLIMQMPDLANVELPILFPLPLQNDLPKAYALTQENSLPSLPPKPSPIAPTPLQSSQTSHSIYSLSPLLQSREFTDLFLSFSFDEMQNAKVNRIDEQVYSQPQMQLAFKAEKILPPIEHYGLEELTDQMFWDENIVVDLSYAPHPDKEGYLFSISVKPEFHAKVTPIRQSFYFVIDRSNSIEKHRYANFKRAVQRALTGLNTNDYFNVVIFDKEIASFSNHPLQANAKNLKAAEEFLEKENYKGLFAATDIYSSLRKIVGSVISDDELVSIILLSDGQTLLKAPEQKEKLHQILQRSDKNISFYTATAGEETDLVTLSLLSYITGGKSIYSDTHASFPRKLVRFVQNLHDPLLSEVSVELKTSDPTAKVMLHLPQRRPKFLSNQSYVIIGETDKLCDLTLFIQGKNKQRWVNIRKNLSFTEAKRNNRGLEKLWSEALMYHCFERFLRDGKRSHLKEAKDLLSRQAAVR